MITNERDIIEAARIDEVLGDFITLKKKGTSLMACCPFHGEKTPSFSVSVSRGIYKCFGCGEGGDSISFLRKQQGMSYPDALRYIAKKYNIEITETLNGKPDPEHDTRLKLKATASVLQAHFCATKEENETNPGRQYWIERGFKTETLDEFGLGYCSGDKPAHVSKEELSAIGATNEAGNLVFYKRSIIPIHDRNGNVVAWAGRTVEGGKDIAKYINSPETAIYSKKHTLFNLHRAAKHILKAGEVWIVEGYADVMAMWQKGVKNVVALCGTALTPEHVAELKKFNGDRNLRFILALDNETTKGKEGFKESVAKAWFSAVEKLVPIGEVKKIIYPPKCKDMADVCHRGDEPEAIEKKDAITCHAEELLANLGENPSPVEIASAQEVLAKLVATIKKDNVRSVYVNQISSLASLKISPREFDKQVKEYRTEGETEAKNKTANEFSFIKVGDEYYQRMIDYDIFTKGSAVVYRRRKRQELTTEGISISTLPRFHDWICLPSHTNYQRTMEVEDKECGETFRFFNSYQPLPNKPKPFDLPEGFLKDPENFDYEQIPEIKHCAAFMKHIFDFPAYRNQYLKIGWDWLTLCYLNPTQRLPALALVSSAEGTGKSTFINLVLSIFGQNATKTDASRIGQNFNAMSAGKVIQCVEETKDERGDIENKLKDLITSFEKVVEAKHQDAKVVKSFDKYVFASNHEEGFMKVGTATTRFFVMKVHPIKEKVHDFEEKLYIEIPYLLYFMQKRGVLTPKEDRLYFNPKLLENEALLKLRHASKDQVQQVMEELFCSIFLRCEITDPVLYVSSQYLKLVMCAYGGKQYDQKTSVYFQKAACADMKMDYSDTPVQRETVELNGIHSDAWINQESWPYDKKKLKTRFIEFPIWKFCTPNELRLNHAPNKLLELILNCEKAGLVGEASEWLEALKLLVENQKIEETRKNDEDIPF